MDKETQNQNLSVIGPSAYISIPEFPELSDKIPAKIDTGAESSAIWASDIHIDQSGILKFRLFDKSSPFYTGKVHEYKDYKVVVTRSAMGEEQIRYRVHLSARIAGKRIRVLFSLADRSKNSFPVLIGKRTLEGKFLVDVSLPDIEYEPKPKSKLDLKTFKENPHKFHQKYIKANQ